MGQGSNGIINTNINQGIGYGSNISIGANSNYSVEGIDASDKSHTNDVGYDFVRGEKKKPNTTMENFQEYMRDKQEQAKEAGEDVAAKEREAKEKAKEVSRSISSEELRQLEMMGIDVDTANMTHLMGMVNTLRFNADSQDTKELMAKIAVDKGQVETMTMVGGQVTVGGTEVTGVSVGDVLVAEDNVVDKVADAEGMVKSSETKDQVLVNDQANIKLSDTEAIYMLKNNLELSKENVYKAHYSGVKLAEGVSEKVLEDIKPQLIKVIEQAGISMDKEAMESARLLIDNDVPLTTDNLRKYMDMKPLMDKTLEEAEIPDKVVAVTEEELEIKANKLWEDVRNIEPKTVYSMVASGKTVTIASATKYGKKIGKEIESLSENDGDIKAITAMRQMEEIRLSMTSAMAGKLIKMDINVDTRELSKVVSMLRNIEEQLTKDAFYAAGVEPTEEKVSLYQEVQAKVNAVAKAPVGIIAAPIMGEDFTIHGLHRRIDSVTSDSQMETVRRSYEAVGTAPRKDMGDSIAKAFGNVKDILSEMDMPVNNETERAVRILGYNQLEITEDNIMQVMDYDRQVNDMLNTFYPEAVIGMIKDGINPLDVPIDELNKKIRSKNYNKGVTEAKNFATFLRDLEKHGKLDAKERESYIGIYRVMEKLSRSGDREAGYLFANGSRLTVRNLITAMRSRKAAGVDVGIDDGFGLLQAVNVSGKKIDQQIESAFEATSDVEELSHISSSYHMLTDDVERFMEDNSLDVNAVNLRAVNVILNQPGSVYSLVSELLGKMKFKTDTTEELLDQEMENITDSISGQEVPVEFSLESILESLRGSEEMSLKYEDLRANLTELMYQWGAAGTLTQMDIATIKTANAGFNILSTMAKQDKFQIPVDTKQGTKVMNLTIKKKGYNSGLIEVSMASEEFGKVQASVKCDEKGMLVGQIISDSSQGNYALKEAEGSIRDAFVEGGYDSEAVSIGSTSTEDLMVIKTIASEKLYQVSVAVVRAMSSIW